MLPQLGNILPASRGVGAFGRLLPIEGLKIVVSPCQLSQCSHWLQMTREEPTSWFCNLLTIRGLILLAKLFKCFVQLIGALDTPIPIPFFGLTDMAHTLFPRTSVNPSRLQKL